MAFSKLRQCKILAPLPARVELGRHEWIEEVGGTETAQCTGILVGETTATRQATELKHCHDCNKTKRNQ